jgi:ribosome-dependent ATPase
LMPAIQFCGLIHPVSSLEGLGAWVGRIYPTAHFLTIARGTFAKGLGFADLGSAFLPLVLAGPVLLLLCTLLLRKQAR